MNNYWLLVITSEYGAAASRHATRADAEMYLATCIMDWVRTDYGYNLSVRSARSIIKLGSEGRAAEVIDRYFADTADHCNFDLLQIDSLTTPPARTAEHLKYEAAVTAAALAEAEAQR